jgi:hypothetical protein
MSFMIFQTNDDKEALPKGPVSVTPSDLAMHCSLGLSAKSLPSVLAFIFRLQAGAYASKLLPLLPSIKV